MGMRKTTLIIWVVVFLSFIVSIYFYDQMPKEVASHWNFRGEVDGYMPRFWGVFLMPFVLAGLSLLFMVIPVIDPLKENIMKFRGYYDRFIILFLVFMFSVHLQIIFWNLGVEVSPNVVFPVGFGVLFFYAGVLCENAKRNWFIGIRTPWTLSSDVVWDKTHKVGGRLFKFSGVVAFFGVFFRDYAFFFMVVPVVLVSVYTVVYSYFEFQREVG